MKSIQVKELFLKSEALGLKLLNPNADLTKTVSSMDLNRPGLALTGFFHQFAVDRVQVFGKGESSYFKYLSPDDLEKSLTQYFKHPIPCLIFTHGNSPSQKILDLCNESNIPLFVSSHSTRKFINLISNFLDERMAPRTSIHGVLVEVFGVGILMQGKSGVGKSETALELIDRGHRLVADDIVEMRVRNERLLYGYVSSTIEHHMEIRGLGIISIKDLFGSGSVRRSKRVDMLIELEDWVQGKEYDRLGLENHFVEILGVKVPSITIPVRPGRNLPILIETAAKNNRLKQMGNNIPQKFDERLKKIIKDKSNY